MWFFPQPNSPNVTANPSCRQCYRHAQPQTVSWGERPVALTGDYVGVAILSLVRVFHGYIPGVGLVT